MSDFLRRLKEAVDTGKPNEAIKAGFNEILNKADQHASDPNAMKALEEKYKKINEEEGKENQLKMTAEEIAALNELAKEQERKIMEFEQDLMVKSGVELITAEIAKKEEKIQKYKAEIAAAEVRIGIYKSNLQYLADDNTYHDKKQVIDNAINEANG